MNEIKKQLRDRKKLAELLGVPFVEEEHKVAVVETVQRKKENASREAEAALLYVADRRKFLQKECLNCGGVFAVNRQNVAYCSDTCRKHALERKGIIWDVTKNPEERWDFKEPLVVPPQVLEHLQDHVQSNSLPTPVDEVLPESVLEQEVDMSFLDALDL